MYIPIEDLPETSKVWIYQSNRKLASEEQEMITTKLTDFISNWEAHGNPLQASFLIKYDRFIIIAVDQTHQAATGCSIDASVKLIQEIEATLKIDLLDKMNVTFRVGEHIAHKTLIDFKKMAKEKAVTANTIVFNNLVNTLGEWHENWEVPASESWHNRFF